MKRLIYFFGALLLPFVLWAADLTDTTSTSNGQLYNRTYKNIGSNTYTLPTTDMVSANSYSKTTAATNSVKATAGYLESVILNAQCANSTVTYVVADAAAAAATYAIVIATFNVTTAPTIPGIYTFRLNFANGLAINTFSSTCPVTAVYR